MMLCFGEKDRFQIQYYPYIEQYKDDPDLVENSKDYELGGSIFFWVNKKNLFAFKDLGPEATYSHFDLSILVDFFCNYLYYHITVDLFPVQTKSKIGINMMDEIMLVDSPDNDLAKYLGVDWDKVDSKLYSEIHSWNIRHGLLTNNGGTFLPDAYIQKVNNKIEISWRNEFPYRSTGGEFYAEHKEGVELIDIKPYRDTVVAFCLEFLSRMEKIYPKRATEFREKLQRAIDVPL